MVWSLALCPDDTKQDSVVYGAEFGVVFLAKGPRTASIQEGLDCLRPNHLGYIHTVANPARGLLNREKKKKEKVWKRPSPPRRAARSEKNKKQKNHATHPHV